MESKSINNVHDTITIWIRNYSDDMFKWALHKISERETAEDIIQETFIAAFKNYDSFKNESSPKTWLFRILNNKIADHYRKSAKEFFQLNSAIDAEVFKATDSFFDGNGYWKPNGLELAWEDEKSMLDNEDFVEVMDKCIDDLPINWRIAVLSKYIVEKDAAEICQELQISSSNYWQILHRSKVLLKKCIEAFWFNKN
ncbi:MAG: sigma-70 family RNA polymerase sigma factor [Cyclobacteriaceae bacterium]|nr:sigma-70 family RNA polymerase sigma factor [Cyclobacteriaceae bacterium]